MASLNQVIQARRRFVLALKRKLKEVDTALEVSERRIRLFSSRRRKVPEEADLNNLASDLRVIVDSLDGYRDLLDTGYPL